MASDDGRGLVTAPTGPAERGHPARPPESILIIKMSSFGDIICALPVLRALRASFPAARIGWVVDDRFLELVAHEPAVDEAIVAPLGRWREVLKSPRRWHRLIAEWRQLKRQLCSGHYEIALDLQGIVKSGIIARAAACPRTLQMAGGRIGRKRRLFPGERIPEYGPAAVDRMLPLAAALGADIRRPRFAFHIPPEAQQHAEALFAAHDFAAQGPVVALNPGAFAPHRMWPRERFAALASRLRQDLAARIVILGGPKEVGLAQWIAATSGANALCAAGKTTYLQLAAVLARCDVVVSGDTGPMHLAVGVGKPVVALFGPSDPARTGPYGPGHIVLQKPFPCQPCYAHPACKDWPCMAAIEVDEVLQAVRDLTTALTSDDGTR